MRTVEKLGVCCAMSLGFLSVFCREYSTNETKTDCLSSAGATAIARSIYIIQLTKQDISCELQSPKVSTPHV